MNVIGTALPRIDGPLKTTGTADYTSDHHFPGLLYAVPVKSPIAKGRIEKLDSKRAETMPGVHAVLHRDNISKIYRVDPSGGINTRVDERRPPFEDDEIRYHGQYVALVLADTFEQANEAARMVQVTYRREQPNVATHLEVEDKAGVTSERGDAAAAFDAAPVKVDYVYSTPPETHNAIELHATVAVPEGDAITLYETTQAIFVHRNVLTQQLGVGPEQVRVVSKFLGSGFGGKLFPWPHSALAATAARMLNRPVKLVTDRAAAFQAAGHRPRTQQRIRLSATREGKLTSVRHDYVSDTSMLDDYEETCGEATASLYSCPNLRVTKGVARRNIGAPTSMRGPGAVPGLFALETGMDELAIALNLDPVQLRILNETPIDENLKVPFSSRHLLECYAVGAEKFGWSQRNPAVGSMKRGDLTLGWGMAACTWQAERFPAEVTIEMRDNGTARVACGTQDIGTGTYTMLAQMAAERLGLPVEKVEVVLGDTKLPTGPISGGSRATASLVPATLQAADNVVKKLISLASTAKGSSLSGQKVDELSYNGGVVHLKGQAPSGGLSFQQALAAARLHSVSGTGKSEASSGRDVSRKSFGAQFVEVTWHPAIAQLRVGRIMTVIDGGRIVNPKTARNQIEGAVVMGIGMGLFEETVYDQRSGAPVNRNLADYVMATHADSPRVDVHFLDYPDTIINEIGARGVGEIGLAGVAAALSNAVYHATGVRVRELPITLDKLLAGGA